MDGEIALHAWQLRLPRECVYCLPVLCDDQRLRFAPWRAGEALSATATAFPSLTSPPRRCCEADALSLAVVPLVGFDGMGIDSAWAAAGTIAASHSATTAPRHRTWSAPRSPLQQVAPFDAESWDVRLDAVCTESASSTSAIQHHRLTHAIA